MTSDSSSAGNALPNAVLELPPAARIVVLHRKAGFLLIGNDVFAYRFSETNQQLTVTNRDGAALFPVLTGDDAREALLQIQRFPQ